MRFQTFSHDSLLKVFDNSKNSVVFSFVTTFIFENIWDQDDFQFNPEHIHGWNAAVYRCKMGRYGTCQMF